MSTFLLLWNPSKFTWKKPNPQQEYLEDDIETLSQKQELIRQWNCGGIKKAIKYGDRIFLMKLGTDKFGNPIEPKGIVAAGRANSLKPYLAPHYAEPNKNAWYIDFEIERLLNPNTQPILGLSALENINGTDKFWTPLSAKSINTEAIALEKMWQEFLR